VGVGGNAAGAGRRSRKSLKARLLDRPVSLTPRSTDVTSATAEVALRQCAPEKRDLSVGSSSSRADAVPEAVRRYVRVMRGTGLGLRRRTTMISTCLLRASRRTAAGVRATTAHNVTCRLHARGRNWTARR
jgi:hypothetical protein